MRIQAHKAIEPKKPKCVRGNGASPERATDSQQVFAGAADSLKSLSGMGALEEAISSAGSSGERLLRESRIFLVERVRLEGHADGSHRSCS